MSMWRAPPQTAHAGAPVGLGLSLRIFLFKTTSLPAAAGSVLASIAMELTFQTAKVVTRANGKKRWIVLINELECPVTQEKIQYFKINKKDRGLAGFLGRDRNLFKVKGVLEELQRARQIASFEVVDPMKSTSLDDKRMWRKRTDRFLNQHRMRWPDYV